jgi:hypothetical protein
LLRPKVARCFEPAKLCGGALTALGTADQAHRPAADEARSFAL